MTIGLSVKQIRKLGKRAYSDKQIERESGEVRASGDKWWSNGHMVLFEPVPSNVEITQVAPGRIVEWAKLFARIIENCKHEVYPVEVLPCICGKKRALRFENGNGESVLINARYAASVLATKRVGKKRDPGVRWYTDAKGETLLAVNGRRVGIVLELDGAVISNVPAWNFRYTGELPN